MSYRTLAAGAALLGCLAIAPTVVHQVYRAEPVMHSVLVGPEGSLETNITLGEPSKKGRIKLDVSRSDGFSETVELLQANAYPAEGGGLEYMFPTNTERRSYPWSDEKPVDYVDAEYINDVKVYKFANEQTSVWVEPKSGTLVDLHTHGARWDEATKQRQWDVAYPHIRALKILDVTRYFGFLIAAGLIITGVVRKMRS
ncbi:DUF3068 domain-containing protein [Corynebacterium freiburgense]|uniref:DUF3068 domain-containing protein n=1 Tax=Corynebacterium freiburgense TaxID=556548 RepID=UPI000406D63F|nr:DUF3068 domain-containing protein [Corynebacterium freiburgense]WJZ03849.1 hypothetical protein CFREI_12975 [Corynebacterium freiburgense]